MHDATVTRVIQVFGSAGLTTLRFNFRSGIGRGLQSVDDVTLAARYLLDGLPLEQRPSRVLIVGYSYGSIPAAVAAAELGAECIGFAMLAPPLDWWAASALYIFNKGNLVARAAGASADMPKLLFIGGEDNFCSASTFESLAEAMPGPKTVRVVPGVDHFSLFRHVPDQLRKWCIEAYGLTDLAELASYSPPAAGTAHSAGSLTLRSRAVSKKNGQRN